MRKKLIAAAVVLSAVVTPVIIARPASAMMCERDLETACSVVGTVVCGVVAKGRPCLY